MGLLFEKSSIPTEAHEKRSKFRCSLLIYAGSTFREDSTFENRTSATCTAFSPDSRTIAIASSDGSVRLWDVATTAVRRTLNGHQQGVRRVAFSPDGRWLASAGQDNTLRVWNIESGRQAARLDVTTAKINAVVFSPDGSLLAAGGGDFLRSGEVRIWRVADILE